MSNQDTCTALAIAVISNTPVILWGDPGQGKTSVVEQLCADYDMHLETVIASIREPSDFAGLPVVDQVTGTVRLAPPAWAENLSAAGKGVAFYDEISTAAPATQAALLRPILSGDVGDLKLPSKVRTIAAANPADIAAGGFDLAPPMANRFLHLNWRLSAEQVREGFTTGWPKIVLPRPDEAVVERNVRDAKVLVGTFVVAHSELLTKMPESSEEGNFGFPTPRSWEQVARLYGTAKAAGCNENVIQMLVSGSVGQTAAGQFLTYAANLDLPDPEALLANPSGYVVPSDRGDKIYATAASVWGATADNNTKDRWGACGDIFAMIAQAGHADIAYVFGTKWAQNRPESGAPSKMVIEHLGPILRELNLLD